MPTETAMDQWNSIYPALFKLMPNPTTKRIGSMAKDRDPVLPLGRTKAPYLPW